ncbi:MAG: fibronectin type III domain-containing protein [Bacteroidota bacterium]|nr:fibronectin type III domain-containing protein [Bacteroidota bacterium]
MKHFIIYNFSRISDPEFLLRADNVINQMSENPNFPNPVPSIESIRTLRDEFNDCLLACMDGGKRTFSIKDQKREELRNALRHLAMYVMAVSDNDVNILASSGFELRREKSPIGLLDKPQNFTIQPGPFPGSVKVSLDVLHGANVYVYQYAPTPIVPESIWTTELGTSSITINGLTLGKEYSFRVAGKGTSKDLIFSNIISRYIA